MIRALEAGLEFPDPVKPDTIAKSLAIGNPADGFQVVKVVKETGGSGAMVTRRGDPRRHPAAGEHRRDLHRAGRRNDAGGDARADPRGVIKPNESVVVCITGNGYKTAEVMPTASSGRCRSVAALRTSSASWRRRESRHRREPHWAGHVSRLPEA